MNQVAARRVQQLLAQQEMNDQLELHPVGHLFAVLFVLLDFLFVRIYGSLGHFFELLDFLFVHIFELLDFLFVRIYGSLGHFFELLDFLFVHIDGSLGDFFKHSNCTIQRTHLLQDSNQINCTECLVDNKINAKQ